MQNTIVHTIDATTKSSMACAESTLRAGVALRQWLEDRVRATVADFCTANGIPERQCYVGEFDENGINVEINSINGVRKHCITFSVLAMSGEDRLRALTFSPIPV